MLLRLFKFTILLFFILLSTHANAGIVNAFAVPEHLSLKPHYSYKSRVIFELEIEDGWHIYWKNAGETGEPTIVELNSFPKESVKKTHFSLPKKFNNLGFTEFGFEKKSYLMVDFDISAPNKVKEIPLDFEIKWLACNGNCVPGSTPVSLKIPVSGKENVKNNEFIKHLTNFNLNKALSGKYYVDENNLSILIPFTKKNNLKESDNIEIFPYNENLFFENEYEIYETKDGLVINTKISEESKVKKIINLLLKVNDNQGVNVKLKKSKKPFEGANNTPFKNVALMGLMAFLGGIILNLMPCILPILSLKTFQLVENKKTRKENIKDALSYTLGILTSFLILGASINLINSKETSIGWGFQMQNPVFILVIIYSFLLIGFMLSDILKVNLNFINSNPKSSYITGILAVLIASPCTAPFMGTAIAFALISKSSLIVFLIFSMLGIGFALPWILIAIFPNFSKLLPKPGKWMEDFKNILAFLIYGTVVWFLWIFMEEVNNHIISSLIVASMIFICFTCFVFKFKSKILKFMTLLLCIIFVSFCFNLLKKPVTSETKSINPSISINEIEEFKLDKTPYFIKFSAKWCLSCLVNEKTIFSRPEIIKEFEENDIKIINIDWTNKDKDIAKLIQNYGGAGVPLYVYFDGEKEIVLPQKISKQYIKELINKE